MSQLVRNTLGMMTGMAVLGAVFFVGSQSLAPYPATGSTAATATVAAPAGMLPANGFTDVAKAVTPAVVNITTVIGEKISGRGGENELRDRMEEFFGGPNGPFGPKFRGPQGPQGPTDPRAPRGFHGGGQGSGVIVSPDGYVLTNNHVIDGAREVTVTLPDKREFQGKIVGADPKTDLAVVKIDAKNLPAVPWGDASKLQVGEYVLAVGNPFGLNSTVTLGIVSALGRGRMGITQYEDFIQTDAAINPGNSGGALVNTKGELVGINTAIFSQTGGYQGIGFAVPSNLARQVVDDIVAHGRVMRGFVGITRLRDLDEDVARELGLETTDGALVSTMRRVSEAYDAGLRPGDVIVAFNGHQIDDPSQFSRLVADAPIGSTATVKVLRNGRTMEFKLPIVSSSRAVGRR